MKEVAGREHALLVVLVSEGSDLNIFNSGYYMLPTLAKYVTEINYVIEIILP
jgi:hypothetical protein